MKLFISYAHEDKETVKELVQALSPFHRIWIDTSSIDPGEDWEQAIQRGVLFCDVFLYIASKFSCASPECEKELLFAFKCRKRIIPLILEECQLHPGLAKLQWITLHNEEDDLEQGVRSLLRQLQPRPPYFWMGLALVEGAVIILQALLR